MRGVRRGGRRSSGGRARLGAARRGGFAVEGKVLGLVVLDGAEEGVVVGGALGGDLPQQKVDMARGGDHQGFCGILGGEGGVIALDGSACRRGGRRAGGKVECHLGFDFKWSAELNRN